MGTKQPDEHPATSPQLNLNTLLCGIIGALCLWIGKTTLESNQSLAVVINSVRAIEARLVDVSQDSRAGVTELRANVSELRVRLTALEVKYEQVKSK